MPKYKAIFTLREGGELYQPGDILKLTKERGEFLMTGLGPGGSPLVRKVEEEKPKEAKPGKKDQNKALGKKDFWEK